MRTINARMGQLGTALECGDAPLENLISSLESGALAKAQCVYWFSANADKNKRPKIAIYHSCNQELFFYRLQRVRELIGGKVSGRYYVVLINCQRIFARSRHYLLLVELVIVHLANWGLMHQIRFTKHAGERLQQRGRSITDVETVLYYGTPVDRGSVVLLNKDVDREIARLKRMIERFERVRGWKVVEIKGDVITVYKPEGRGKSSLRRVRLD